LTDWLNEPASSRRTQASRSIRAQALHVGDLHTAIAFYLNRKALNLDHQYAAVDVNHSAGDETRFLPGEEGYTAATSSG
jgi:hypothetical protein